MNRPTEQQFRRYINPHYPDRPRRLPDLTTDELVSSFLALHDVDVAPVGADIRMSRGEAVAMGAAFGLLNPVAWDTMATGSHMKQDARIAARQEWTSWKQWTLGHADWPAFKQEIADRQTAVADAAEAWETDPANQAEFQRLIEKERREAAEQDERRAGLRNLAPAAVMTLVVVAAAFEIHHSFRQMEPSSPPLSTQQPQR